MKTRLISSVIGVAVLLAVVWSHQIVLGIAVFLVSLLGMHEFYNSVASAGYRPIRILGYLSCIPIFFIGLNGIVKKVDSYVELFRSINYFSLCIFIIVLILFSSIVFLNRRYNLNDIALTAFGMLYVSFLFSFVVLTRNLNNGFFFVWLIFIGAWATDILAYFTGILAGKTKVLPEISPKKTIEGCIGGVVGSVTFTIIYGIFINKYIGDISFYHFAVIGVLNGIISQIGDWGASAIKRFVGIKDFGSIMPGHGGVLDRVDSMLFVAPTVYFYISFVVVQ